MARARKLLGHAEVAVGLEVDGHGDHETSRLQSVSEFSHERHQIVPEIFDQKRNCYLAHCVTTDFYSL